VYAESSEYVCMYVHTLYSNTEYGQHSKYGRGPIKINLFCALFCTCTAFYANERRPDVRPNRSSGVATYFSIVSVAVTQPSRHSLCYSFTYYRLRTSKRSAQSDKCKQGHPLSCIQVKRQPTKK
jgi:hypothetical protein